MDFLNKHANVQVAVVDTGIDQFVIDEDAEGYSTGRACGWDLTQVAAQIKFCRARGIAMIWPLDSDQSRLHQYEGNVPMPALRVLHRFSALIVGLFLALHLANHFVGLVGQRQHIEFMQTARVLYRYSMVEVLLLVLLVWQACSGLVLLARRWKARDGVIAWLQIVSGAYLLAFLINHVGAVLYGRFALGLDTDFRFAAAGFHVGSLGVFFAPYYALAIVALFTHVGCAVYWTIGSTSPVLRKSVLGAFMLVGATAGLLVVLALMGVLYEVDIPDAYKATYGALTA